MIHLLFDKKQLVLIWLLCITPGLQANSTTSYYPANDSQTTPQNDSQLLIYKFKTWVEFAQHFVPLALFIDRYVTIIYYILGFPGNMISFIIWSNRRMNSNNSSAIYLAALSLNDMLVLAFALNRDLSRLWNVKEYYLIRGSCEVRSVLIATVQYASPLFVLGFTIERWFAICRPFSIDRLYNCRRAIYICIAILLSTMFVCTGHGFLIVTVDYTCDKPLAVNKLLTSIYLASLESIFAGFVPLMILGFNCLVIRELARIHRTTQRQLNFNSLQGANLRCELKSSFNQKSKKSSSLGSSSKYSCTSTVSVRTSLGCDMPAIDENGQCLTNNPSSSCHSENAHHPSFKSTTFMLLIVSFYTIVCTLLGGLLYLIQETGPQPDMYMTEEEVWNDFNWRRYFKIVTIKSFGDEIALSHYAFGFIIYYTTGQNFKHHVHQLFARCFRHCHGKNSSNYEYDDYFVRSRRTQKRSIPMGNVNQTTSLSNQPDALNPNVE